MELKQIVNITRRKMDRNVFDVLSKGLRKRSSQPPKKDHLLSMNAPPLAAKLDAACEIAFKILSSDVSNLMRTDRFQVYEKAVGIIDEARETNLKLTCALDIRTSSRHAQSLAVLLDMMADLMGAILSVLNAQIAILDNQNNPLFSPLSAPGDDSANLNDRLVAIEKDMRSSVNQLLETASLVMSKEKEKRDFKHKDKERYEKALLEFRRKLS